MNRLPLAAILFCVLTITCVAGEQDPADVCKILESLSLPGFFIGGATDEDVERAHLSCTKFKSTIRELDKYDLPSIREGLCQYVKSKKYDSLMSFVVLQYIFVIPKRGDAKYRKVGHIGHIHYDQRIWSDVPESVPWRQDDDGKIHFLFIILAVSSTGGQFDPLKVFDRYQEHLDRRIVKW